MCGVTPFKGAKCKLGSAHECNFLNHGLLGKQHAYHVRGTVEACINAMGDSPFPVNVACHQLNSLHLTLTSAGSK